jgi:hypothetical protein
LLLLTSTFSPHPSPSLLPKLSVRSMKAHCKQQFNKMQPAIPPPFIFFRVFDGLSDNSMVQVNALHFSTAYTTTDRPLAKPSTAPTPAMIQLKKDASRAPPPKGRRNLNSQEFLGALSHDFCPIANSAADATQPTDYSYSVWRGNGENKIQPTVIQSLPVKEYCIYIYIYIYININMCVCVCASVCVYMHIHLSLEQPPKTYCCCRPFRMRIASVLPR